MFVITKLNTKNNECFIISVHNTENEAIENLHKSVNEYKKDEKVYDVLIIDSYRIEIISRNPGWFASGKMLEYVHQIISYNGYYSKFKKGYPQPVCAYSEYIDSETSDEDNIIGNIEEFEN